MATVRQAPSGTGIGQDLRHGDVRLLLRRERRGRRRCPRRAGRTGSVGLRRAVPEGHRPCGRHGAARRPPHGLRLRRGTRPPAFRATALGPRGRRRLRHQRLRTRSGTRWPRQRMSNWVWWQSPSRPWRKWACRPPTSWSCSGWLSGLAWRAAAGNRRLYCWWAL
ncbi:hypothetical protein ACRAWF_22305 [Streptomyces sp. L7]